MSLHMWHHLGCLYKYLRTDTVNSVDSDTMSSCVSVTFGEGSLAVWVTVGADGPGCFPVWMPLPNSGYYLGWGMAGRSPNRLAGRPGRLKHTRAMSPGCLTVAPKTELTWMVKDTGIQKQLFSNWYMFHFIDQYSYSSIHQLCTGRKWILGTYFSAAILLFFKFGQDYL